MSQPVSGAPIITFGEVLLRLSPPSAERFFQSPQLRTQWGGAEANVAAGLAWLGGRSAHVTLYPDNTLGEASVRALQGDGVDMSHAQRGLGRQGLYFLDPGAGQRPLAVTYDRAGSAFASQRGDEFDWMSILTGAAWLHVSGVSAALGDGAYRGVRHAVDAAHALGVPVSLDLNHRPALWAGRDPRPLMQPLAARAALLVANPGAIEVMLGIATAGDWPEPRDAVEVTARAVHEQFGCARVAVTQREILSASEHAWQAHLLDALADRMWSAHRYRMGVVDRVGGGDSFVAALLHQFQQGAMAEEALHFATAASALKLTIPGDVNRVTHRDITQFLSSFR
ncbi:PfkB family carbohydrate kinase [Gemmatimonas sp.]|jgi:2-dehydro-3-deoxygluconokinase|uniref:PfkB family carbohydrate kinase n=1 Tax=Gemmatimonas sp. TaxID=1962908 RepID=UPI0037BE4D53